METGEEKNKNEVPPFVSGPRYNLVGALFFIAIGILIGVCWTSAITVLLIHYHGR